MPTNRREYMRDYMAKKRAAEKERGLVKDRKAKPVDRPLDTVDTSTAIAATSRKPSFLAAPDDDCMVCGHDRQSYHLAGACTAAVTYKGRCGCPAFVDAAEPF